jgi:stress-induced-phosphoprotein 1
MKNVQMVFDSLVDCVSDENKVKSEEFKALGNQAFLAKDYVQAIIEYSQAIEYNNKNELLWSNRSACYILTNQNFNALLDAEICRRLNPSWTKGCYRLAAARLALGYFEDAAVAAFEGCKLDNNNVELKEIMKKAVKLGREAHEKENKS